METTAVIVNELLDGKNNYEKWSIQVKAYLRGRDLWDTVDHDSFNVNEDEDEEDGKAKLSFAQKDAAALHTILVSCETEAFMLIKTESSARNAWAALKVAYGPKLNGAERKLPVQTQRRRKNKFESSERFQTEADEFKIPSQDAESHPSRLGIPRGQIKPFSSSQVSQRLFSGNGDKEAEPNTTSIIPYPELFKVVKLGDWDSTLAFLDQNPDAIRAVIPYSEKNILHVAVSEGRLNIVQKLMNLMTDEEIEMRRVDKCTPLAAAIEVGNFQIVKCLVRRHRKLLTLTHPEGLPVRYAIMSCRTKMVPYLYSLTPIKDLMHIANGVHCAALLSQCIYAKHYDIALSLLFRVPELAITVDSPGKSPLWALATSVLFSDTKSTLAFWQGWIYKCIHISSWATHDHVLVEIENLEDYQSDKEDSNLDRAVYQSFCLAGRMCSGTLMKVLSIPLRLLGIRSIYRMKLARQQIKEILKSVCQLVEKTSDRMRFQNAGLANAMVQAGYHGNVDFIIGIAKANPEFVWSPYISRKVIEAAIKHRQPKIFSLVYGLPNKLVLASHRDEDDRSNMLQKAAIIADESVLNRIPGAALQMQKELQWFKEVESIVSQPSTTVTTADHPGSTAKKKEYLTARQIFTESHKDLMIAGEQWMKDTASSCTVVGALIITMTFAAAFTFPGGNEGTGFPMFRDKMLFRVFMISNAVALSSSTTSVLMFLGILTSRYAEEDFLTSLPKKLIIGLSTLFLSMAAMLTAFCVGLSLMFQFELWIVLPSALLAGIPIALFAAMQFPLLVDISMSTYGPSIFSKDIKRWI